MCKAWQVFKGGSEGDDDEAQLEAVLDPSKVPSILSALMFVYVTLTGFLEAIRTHL